MAFQLYIFTITIPRADQGGPLVPGAQVVWALLGRVTVTAGPAGNVSWQPSAEQETVLCSSMPNLYS